MLKGRAINGGQVAAISQDINPGKRAWGNQSACRVARIVVPDERYGRRADGASVADWPATL